MYGIFTLDPDASTFSVEVFISLVNLILKMISEMVFTKYTNIFMIIKIIYYKKRNTKCYSYRNYPLLQNDDNTTTLAMSLVQPWHKN